MRKEAQHEIPCLGVIVHTYAVWDREMIVRRRGLASSRRPTADICLIQNPPQLPPIGGVEAIRLLRIPMNCTMYHAASV